MKTSLLKGKIHPDLFKKLDFETLRPSQAKSIESGLLDRKNLLVCTPTASGKTLIAEMAIVQGIYDNLGKGIYIVPLKALATEKYRYFKEKYPDLKVSLSIGDSDSADLYLERSDIIITVSEKLDSLIRHRAPWLRHISTVIIDEIHLLNDTYRGPTLEIVITILRKILKKAQFIGLSATIGNPQELSDWLDSELVIDNWRPVTLEQGVYLDGEIEFH